MAKILVVEDNRAIRAVVSEILTRDGHEVTLAADGDEGLLSFREGHPDVVLCDIFMPRKDGIETIVELRREYPEARIIAMSGGWMRGMDVTGPDTDILAHAQRSGADAILEKPFEPTKLRSVIERLLSR